MEFSIEILPHSSTDPIHNQTQLREAIELITSIAWALFPSSETRPPHPLFWKFLIFLVPHPVGKFWTTFNHYIPVTKFWHFINFWNKSFINSTKLIIWSHFWNIWTTFWCPSPYVRIQKLGWEIHHFFPLTPPPFGKCFQVIPCD